jgi:choline dehydrogenase-like flavoprotein
MGIHEPNYPMASNGVTGGNYDYIIVGTGPGGATVGRDLIKAKKKVLFIEWGGFTGPGGGQIQAFKEMWTPFKGMFVMPRQILGVVRAITVGGSSLYFYGSCVPLPLEMFKKRGVDLREPMAEVYRDIPYLKPLRDEVISPIARSTMEAANSLGGIYNWKPIDKFIDSERITPDWKFGVTDPRELKWTAHMWIREAMQLGAGLLTRSKVSKVLFEGKRAVGVEYKNKGKLHKAYANTIILAASGIGTPIILRKSGIMKNEIGTDFFFDPFATITGQHPHLTRIQSEIPMQTGQYFPDDHFVMTDFYVPGYIIENMLNLEVGRVDHLFKMKHTSSIMIKLADEMKGGTLGPGGYPFKHMSKIDWKRMKVGVQRGKDVLKKAGCKDVHGLWYLGAHPGGTVRLGTALDHNLQTPYDNLYVCDCSVIPEPCGLPPVLTVMALGKHLSKHLLSKK